MQKFKCMLSKFWRSNVQHVTAVRNSVLSIRSLLREWILSGHHPNVCKCTQCTHNGDSVMIQMLST